MGKVGVRYTMVVREQNTGAGNAIVVDVGAGDDGGTRNAGESVT